MVTRKFVTTFTMVDAENSTFKSSTLTRMKNVYSLAEDFTISRRDEAERVMKTYDISGSELALNLGHSAIFERLRSATSRKQLLRVCYTGFLKLHQDLTVLNKGHFFLRDECGGLANMFQQQHREYGYSLPETSHVNMETNLNNLMQIFLSEDPIFIDMFHGKPPKPLVKAARDYQLSLEMNLSLNDLAEFLWNNIE